MKFSTQNYLDCYQKLHSAQFSRNANKTLIQIEESEDAWKIAEELMLQEKDNIHGSQLLSKKLNLNLPAQINPQLLAQFILSMQPISNIHWLCLAKIFIHTHLNIQDLKIQGPLRMQVKLNIIQQIPYALGQMRTNFSFKNDKYKKEIFKQNKQLILQSIQFVRTKAQSQTGQTQKIKDLVLGTLESFTQHKVRLQSQQIAQFVLQCAQSDKSSTILQYLFLEQEYPQIQDKFESFLQINLGNKEKDWIKSFYLNFYAKKDIYNNFSLQKYKNVLETVVSMVILNDQEEFWSILSDSFQILMSLIKNLGVQNRNQSQLKLNIEKQRLLKQSVFTVFQYVCRNSKLKKCPQHIKVIESNLDIIDLDSQQGIIESKNSQNDQFSQSNYHVYQIRELSIDLLVKIQQGLKSDGQLYKRMFETLLILALDQKSIESLELVIFIVDGMTDFCDQKSKPYLSELIKIILNQQQRFNEYICQRIVIMLGKIDKIIISNLSMLPLVFQFFSNSIMYERLASLASESFADLIDQYEVSNLSADEQFKQKSQNYLNFWFQNLYEKIQNQKVLQNITKALIIFIFKFKGPQYYSKFLFMMRNKIVNSQDQSLRQIYLQAVVTGQSWINSKEQNNEAYLVAFGDFMNEFVDLLAANCFKVNRKSQFSKAISKVNWCVKAGAYFTNLTKWLQMLKHIINKALFQSTSEILPVSLTPLINILKSQTLSQQHLKKVFKTVNQIINPLTQLFVKFHEDKSTVQYNFTKYVIQLHNALISKMLMNKQIVELKLINYDPNLLYGFIKTKIFQNKIFWEYQVYKESLIYLNQLVLSNYLIHDICFEVLCICARTSESLWIQTQNLFLNLFKIQGLQPFFKGLQKIKPQILPPSPLFAVLQQGLEKSDRKLLKSFVRCL